MSKEVYLSGATKKVEQGGVVWRLQAQRLITDSSEFRVFIPNFHYDYKMFIPETDKACLSLFMNRLRATDILLVNLEDSDGSVGTGIEVAVAHENRIPIIGFNDKSAYNWTREMCDVVLDDLEAAVRYIHLHYGDM